MQNKQLQINAFYLKKLVNSCLNPMTENSFLTSLELFFNKLFDVDISPLMKSVPESVSDGDKIAILRDILNGRDKCSVENIPDESVNIIHDIQTKVQIIDITDYNYDKNLSLIFDALDADNSQRKLVQCLLSLRKNPMLRDMLDCFDIPVMHDMICEEHVPFFAAMCEIPSPQIRKMISENSILFESNILTKKFNTVVFHESFIKLLQKQFQSVDEVRDAIVGEPIVCDLHAENFLHLSDAFRNVQDLLQKSGQSKTRGVNVLVVGNVGCGKTSFAKSVALDAGLRLYSGLGSDASPDTRRNTLCQMQKMLKNVSGVALLCDDAEDILGQEKYSMRGNDKLSLHKLLEENATPVVWVVSTIEPIPNSCLRRFSLTVKMSTPDEDVRKDVWAGVFKKHNLEFDYDKLSEKIKEMDVPLAMLDNAVHNAEITGNPDMVPYTLNSLIKTLHGKEPEGKKTEPKDTFNPGLINTDTDLNMLATRIATKKLRKFSLCLYGAPGTGKTAYAEHLAKVLGMPIVKKRASDLKGSYVGETEKNIARAFAEARAKQALLVFDEADSFLQDRNKATRPWEISSVNEMLTQMGTADFPFVCTTNLMDSLDTASLRRFTFKVKYDFLTPHQVVIAFNEFFGQTVNESDIKKCVNLTPGDFVVVKNKAEILDITETNELLDMLLQEQSVKSHNVQKIGF